MDALTDEQLREWRDVSWARTCTRPNREIISMAAELLALRAERRALLDALEQAQKERDRNLKAWSERLSERNEAIAQRDQAQKDAKDARALLRVIWAGVRIPGTDLRARIEAMSEQKP